MNHHKMKILVSASLDGEVTAQEKAAVHAHLTGCPECRQFVEESKLMRKEIGALGTVTLPHVFAARLAYSVEKKDEQTMEWLGIEPLARNTFILLAGLVVLFFFVAQSTTEAVSSPNNQFVNRITSNSMPTNILLQPEKISKSDVLYAVMTK
jgi:predicted anti-sigma-YlaC factor YlaD